MTPLIIIAVAWIAIVGLGHLVAATLLTRGPSGDPLDGLTWYALRLYNRVVHRVRYRGTTHIPDTNRPEQGFIVLANHTCGVDPLLIQGRCRFMIRWLMAAEMMIPRFDWAWSRYRIIPVQRHGRDLTPLREAIREVRAGGVVGIFPEGGIANPPRQIRPFLDGAGFIIARAKAPVLLVWISGTPSPDTAWGALTIPSHARVTFVDWIEFGDEHDVAGITRTLRERLAAVSGWPLNDEPLPTAVQDRPPSTTMPT